MLHVRLFGGTHVLDGPHVLGPGDFGGRKPQRILEALALHRRQRVTKDRLTDILWADTPPPDHLSTVESYVSLLRRHLQPGMPARQSVIRTVSRAYLLDPATTSTDLDLFDDLVAEADNRSDQEARSLLDHASALASTGLLDSADDTWWAEPIRADYRHRAVRAALRAGELALPHDADAALRLAGRALGLDILCEPAWRLMIRAHATTGHRNEALRAYRSCRNLLTRELGIRPAPQTRAALADVVTGTRRSADPHTDDLDTVIDATLTLFEHHRIGEASTGLDDAVRVISALLPSDAPTSVDRPATTIDPRHALRSAGARLIQEFDGILRHEIVQRFLYADYDRLRANSTVRNHLPLLAERSARRRLRALAAADPDSPIPTVVFLHTPGTAYSRMALGFFEHLAGDRAVAWCEGSEPDRTSPAAIASMAERGIDITGQVRRPWTDRLARTVDIVVAIGDAQTPAAYPSRRHLHWKIDKITDDHVENIRPIRDAIERQVATLLDGVGALGDGSG
ncbi:MAG TPA: BTAD domain-containing putative transcriptional regulator [Pseudonocardiaceae bacterium]|nr:BTAD domain-containing putative transcriptional regulator [Pseudonocardiaceae bacterium]